MTRGGRSKWRPVLWTGGVIASLMIAWACNINPLGPYDSHDLIVELHNRAFPGTGGLGGEVYFQLDGSSELVRVERHESATLRIGEIRLGETRIFHVYASSGPPPSFLLITGSCLFTGNVSINDTEVVYYSFIDPLDNRTVKNQLSCPNW